MIKRRMRLMQRNLEDRVHGLAVPSLTPRRFLSLWIIGIFVVLCCSAMVVWREDPFDQFVSRQISSDAVEREETSLGGLAGWRAKAILNREYPHDALLIGTSKLLDTDPKDLAFFNYFNASLGNANLDEILEYLKVFAPHLKLVVLGIDFLQFNEGVLPALDSSSEAQLDTIFNSEPDKFRNPLPQTNVLQKAEYLLNGNAALSAIERIVSPLSGDCSREIVLYPQGNYNKPSIVWQNEFIETQHRSIIEDSYRQQLEHLRTVNYANFIYSEHRETTLRQIKDLLAKNHVELVAFLNPINDRELPLIQAMGLSSSYARFVKAVTTIFGEDAAIPLRNYGNPKYFYDFDPIHFLPETGAEIVNRMVAKHFGVVLPPGFQVFDRVEELTPIASSAASQHDPAKAFDHTIATAWTASSSNEVSWIGARFPAPRAIQKIVITQLDTPNDEQPDAGKARRNSVIVQMSTDGDHWQTVTPHSVCVPSRRSTLYINDKVPARYWRVVATDSASGRPRNANPWQVDEIAFYVRRAGTTTLKDYANHLE